MNAVWLAVVLSLVAQSATGVPIKKLADPSHPGCITSGAPKDGPGIINVHIIPHTHDDVGWLKTVDQYYYGSNNTIQHAGVQYILDTVIAQCMLNPDRKFTYVEQAFFQRWWAEQTEAVKVIVRGLVARGQLQFINGGWSMHDEACTHYVSMIENTALGHRFLKDQFDYVPTVGWQIDPFGHSSVQASLLSAEAGFDALYFARIDWQEKSHRLANNDMEMIWRASPSLGADAEVFTGAFLDGNYGPPHGLCFDGTCNDNFPIMDDLCMEDDNVQDYIDLVVETAMKYANNTKGDQALGAKNIMFLMGDDFQYENADTWFKNLDKVIHYVNKDGRVNAFYSTPVIYTEAKLKQNVEWGVKTDDFMPLANDAQSYWTGFYASRPTLKRYERVQAGYLQGARQLQMFANLVVNYHVKRELGKGPWYSRWFGMDRHDMDPLAAAVALNQHHDAITGTEKQHVAYDYALRLASGGAVADMAVSDAFEVLTKKPPMSAAFEQCKLLNETVCLPSHVASRDGKNLTLSVYNPLATPRLLVLRIPIASPTVSVIEAASSKRVAFEVAPAPPLAGPQQFLQNQNISSPYLLVFKAMVPPMGLTTFNIIPSASPPRQVLSPSPVPPTGAVIQNAHLKLVFSAETGLLETVENLESGVAVNISQSLMWYEAAQNDDEQKSGAYIMRTNSSSRKGLARCVSQNCKASVSFITGQLCTEVRQTFAPWAVQTYRLCKGSHTFDVEWTVGPVPIDDGLGKEIISRFTTNIESQAKLLTDSNGRDMLERQRCSGVVDMTCRPSVPGYLVTEPVAGNFFPVNTAAVIRDSKAALSVLVDRAQGVASLWDGEMEILIHRRLLKDDNRGVGEPLNETQSISPYDWKDDDDVVHREPVRIGKGLVVRGTHTISLTTPAQAAREYRRLQDELYYSPVLGFSAGMSFGSDQDFRSGLAAKIPKNVAILTVEMQPSGSVLMRVGHKYAIGEDAELSVDVALSLSTLFQSAHLAKPTSVEELSLTANQSKQQMLARRKNRRFASRGGAPDGEGYTSGRLHSDPPQGPDMTVTLAPLQIRTFLLHYGS